MDEARTILTGRLRSTTIGLLILITLIAFEAMAVSAALPTAAREVHGLGSYGWAFTGFLIANIVGMVVSGEISDTAGPKPPVVAGLAAFVAGLALSGTATTMLQLVAGRVVQGLGSGLMITAIYVVMGQAYPSRLQPPLFAAISSAWVVPSLVGPVVSGLLTEHASWRWVFLGLVPFSIVGGALMVPALRTLRGPARGVPDTGRRTTRRIDAGRVVRAFAVAAGVAALEGAGQHPTATLLVLAAAGLAAMIWGLRVLLPPGTVRVRPGPPAPIALRGLLAGAFFGAESLLPLSLTVQHGFSATAAGLPLAASGVSWALGSWWQGRAVAQDDASHRIALIRAGFLCLVIAMLGLAVSVLPAAPGWLAYPTWLIAGLGAGLTMSSVGVLLLRYTTEARRGSDSAALQLSDATSSAITTGVAGVLVAAAARGVIGDTAAFVGLDLLMCAVAAVGLAVAGRAHPAQATQPGAEMSARTSI